MKINLIVLKSAHPDELATFYRQLGVQFEHHRHGNGPLHYAATLEEVVFEIYPLPNGKDNADDTLRLGFTVQHLVSTIEKIKDTGGKIIKEPTITEWGYIAIIEDLDGRKVEVKEI